MSHKLAATSSRQHAHQVSHTTKKAPLPARLVLQETLSSFTRAALFVASVYVFFKWFLYPIAYNEHVEDSLWNRTIFASLLFSSGHLLMFFAVNSVLLPMQLGYIRSVPASLYVANSSRRTDAFPTDLVWRAIKEAPMDQILSDALFFILLPLFFKAGALETDPLKTPSVPRVILTTVLNKMFAETAFYWVHRSLHSPSLYSKLHKKHHQFVHSTGFGAEYATWIEQITSNLFPILTGSILLRYHLVELLAWLVYRLLETYEIHSGLTIFFNTTALHDHHHSSSGGNYGLSPFWDYVMGTYSDEWAQNWMKQVTAKGG